MSKESQKIWNQKNKQRIRELQADWRKKNREKCRLAVKRYRLRHPEYKIREAEQHIARTYNLSAEQYDKLLQSQNNACSICKGPPNGRGAKFVVDHDHRNNSVRGLLCDACNRALGFMKDDPTRLREAANYLERHKMVTKSVLKRWQDGELNSTEALAELGALIKANTDKLYLDKLQAMVDEIVGIPEELPEDNELDKQAWERYHRGE